MDVHKTLRELYEEKRRLDSAIAALEGRIRATPAKTPGKRRGRKSMSPEERKQASLRMMKYWENRKAQAKAVENESGFPTGTASE